MDFDKEYTLGFLREILAVDSPTGFTGQAVARLQKEAESLGLACKRTNKGNPYIVIPGREQDKTIGYCAHLDTLGLMVSAVKSDGRLAFTKLGGPILPTLDGEYCRVYTREGKVYSGTILSNHASAHVFSDNATLARDMAHMEVRLDEVVRSAEETRALGIENGDIICIDTKTQITENGFIKSRFLDDKLSVAILFGLLKRMKGHGEKPRHDTVFLFSTYEEIGHGMAYLPVKLDELIGVDMGCVGDDLRCDETMVSICAKDSTGPYDYDITSRLIALCKQHDLQYAVDVYPYYGSDVSAAYGAGNDIRGALVGAGVHASHGMERSHYQGMENTMRLLTAYMELE